MIKICDTGNSLPAPAISLPPARLSLSRGGGILPQRRGRRGAMGEDLR